MTRSTRRRLFAKAPIAGLLVACAWATGAAAGDKPPEAAQDLAWGEVLFHFYQADYVPAITRILVAEERGEYAHHGDESDLVLGGLYLNYGLHETAGRIFETLLDESRDPVTRARAWYYLARIRHERGYQAEALAALERIGSGLPERYVVAEVDLKSRVLMSLERYEEAIVLLESSRLPGIWQQYAWYNLGVALIRAGQSKRGGVFLKRVGVFDGDGAGAEEMLALKDRANLALGYAQLAAEDVDGAREALDRVRLEGPFASRALLGAGWADTQAGDYRAALAPWRVLTERDPLDAAVQESLLALPYAYAQLSASRQAVTGYRVAIDGYEQELGRLDSASVAVRAGELTSALDALRADGAMGWAWELDRVPDSALGRYLYPLMAGHAFQESYKNFRDLQELHDRLSRWRDSLDAFHHMLEARKQRLASRLPGARASLDVTSLDTLVERHEKVSAELARIRADGDVAALATAEERKWQTRLDRGAGLLAARPGHPMLRDIQDRHRRLNGLLYWRMHEAFPDRLREAEKANRQTARALAESAERRADIEASVNAGVERLAPLDQRIDAAGARVDTLRERTRELLAAQQAELASLALAELDRRRGRVKAYLGQARYALAASYDRAARVTADEDAP